MFPCTFIVYFFKLRSLILPLVPFCLWCQVGANIFVHVVLKILLDIQTFIFCWLPGNTEIVYNQISDMFLTNNVLAVARMFIQS